MTYVILERDNNCLSELYKTRVSAVTNTGADLYFKCISIRNQFLSDHEFLKPVSIQATC
jgi:hypothetical protein